MIERQVMKNLLIVLGGIALFGNLALTGLLLNERGKENSGKSKVGTDSPPITDHSEVRGELEALRSELVSLRDEVELIRGNSSAPSGDPRIKNRLAMLEKMMGEVEEKLNGPSVEELAAERMEQFKAEDGFLKAAEYFEAGKYELAGQGYLTFLAAHPDHPEHRSLVKKARQAFAAAGNLDRAIAVQEELMEIYPENKAGDLMDLAKLQQQAGKYQEAAENAASSAELTNDSSKYWNLLYSAWYTQLGEGLDAGLTAHREVEAQITAAGHGDGKLGERVREKIAEIEREQARQGQ